MTRRSSLHTTGGGGGGGGGRRSRMNARPTPPRDGAVSSNGHAQGARRGSGPRAHISHFAVPASAAQCCSPGVRHNDADNDAENTRALRRRSAGAVSRERGEAPSPSARARHCAHLHDEDFDERGGVLCIRKSTRGARDPDRNPGGDVCQSDRQTRSEHRVAAGRERARARARAVRAWHARRVDGATRAHPAK